MKYELPGTLRRKNGQYKVLETGVGGHLPAWFVEGVKAVDKDLHLVWHPYELIYDDIMNVYEGEEAEGRFSINEVNGQQVWGWPLKEANSDRPLPNNKWHAWRLCYPYGWAHVAVIEDTHEEYLQLLLRRLHRQATISDSYGNKAYIRATMEEKEQIEQARQKQADELFNDVQAENAWLMRRAMESFDRGETKPTNPQMEKIISYPGQKNHSKIIRPLTDTEGGLVLPDSWKN